jgi:tetratricopeptide (TPR) repeat protein
MTTYKYLIFLFFIGLSSCKSFAQTPDNKKPMYGEVEKNESYKQVDQDFKKESLAQFGSIDSSVKVYIDHAWRYFYHNDLNTAMKRFNQVWLLDSQFADSYFGFAALMEMQQDKSQAERFYKMGLSKDVTKTRALICYKRIADCKEQLQDYDGTIAAYEKILEINPNEVFALKKIGYFKMQTGNSEDALKAYRKAIELDPGDAMTYNNRAYLYQTKKDYNNAIADYAKAIELDPSYIGAYVNRGVTEMEMGDFNAAKRDFEFCVKLDGKSGELRRMLGLSKMYAKDKIGACKDFESAKQLGDEQAEVLIKQNCL